MNTIDGMLAATAADAASFARAYAGHVSGLLRQLDASALARFADVLLEVRDAGRTVFVAGNGGSAATASHWAVDLMHGTFAPGALPLRTISLVDNVPGLTAIANDRSYGEVFTAQLEKLLQPGDVLVVISASGSSPNVVGAVEYANAHGATTLGVLGFDGGRLKERCHHAVVVATAKGEYGPVEDVHLVVNHILTMWLKSRFAAAAR